MGNEKKKIKKVKMELKGEKERNYPFKLGPILSKQVIYNMFSLEIHKNIF